ncbi:hypothetical protein A2630_02620 [Candidatus Woesebacteria bacterium RIFCSPHIGHO2_01_FULL_44_10]|nr:MAG: hypothetical protein A2630_02620 [Candidatus Woesebacteria bacterium RIFCSPHIGHO2_01_FULL_44_10]
MAGLNLPKISELMSPLERAKLVISLELKVMAEPVSENGVSSIEGEIKQVVAACPNSQIREYNSYLELKNSIWRILMLIELDLSDLRTFDGRMMVARHLLVISPTLETCLQIVKAKQGNDLDREWDALLYQLDSLALVKIEGERLVLSVPLFADVLRLFKERFVERTKEINGYIELIKGLEQKYFEGMEIISRDSKHPTGVITRAKKAIGEIAENHNKELKEMVDGFNLLGMGIKTYKWEQINEFLVEAKDDFDNEWVEKELAKYEERA